MGKPKVLRIINRLNLGGPTYNAAYLSKYLEDDFETLLIAGMKDESEASSEFIINNLGLNPRYIKHMYRSLNPLKDRKSLKEIRTIIRAFKPDIVHTHASKAGAVGRWAAIQENVPIIIHTFHGHVFHSYFNPIKTKIFLNIERYLAKKTSKIIAISNLQKKELCEDFRIAKKDKFQVVPLGFDLHRFQENTKEKRAQFRKKYDVDEETVAIGIIGRLVPIKNHTFFLKAIKALVEKGTNHPIKVFIIGDGEEREKIEQQAKTLNIEYSTENCTHHNKPLVFTSWIKKADVATSGLDIITLTSLNEGTPVSLIEASAAGKPIVTTNVGGIKDVVKDNINAYILEKDDVEGFAHKLQILVNNKVLRHQMGIEGMDYAFSQFSHTRLVDDVRGLYLQLLKEKQLI